MVEQVVAEGRARPDRFGSGGLYEGFGNRIRCSLNMGRLLHAVTECDDVRHKVLVYQWAIVKGQLKFFSQCVEGRPGRGQKIHNISSRGG